MLLTGVLLVAVFAALSATASADAPNPTSIVINSVTTSGSNTTVTVSGTWTWDKRVPAGARLDCNDTRVGVGVAVVWGDNKANPLKVQNSTEIVYVGNANDNWVHSVTQGTQTVDGPFKPSPSKVTESMLGETPDAVLNGFGQQGISSGASTAKPTKADAEHWFSNCGPTEQSTVDGQLIGNSNPKEPTKGYPNGTWGPISHTYTTPGSHTICPVMYDPHGKVVGEHTPNEKEITAGGTGHNGDNSIESNGNKSACVVSVVESEPEFTIKKEQRFEGESSYRTTKLAGTVGQRVEYKITVTDTGSTSLTLKPLSDAKCETVIVGPSANPIKPGESATFTCSRLLNSVGTVTNVATEEAEGGGKTVTHTSNEVEAEAKEAERPEFTIKKEQRFEGEGSYRTTKLAGTVGQRVEYKITVTNTGNTSLTLKPLSDAKCETVIVGPSANPIKPGESATFTCSRLLSSVGTVTNVATEEAEGGGKTVTHTSNEVEAEAKEPELPAFTIKKEQRFEGESSYRTTKLAGTVGQRVEYKITVTNTGNTSLTLKPLSDAKCESGTLSGPSENPIKPGESAFFTCSRVLPFAGVFFNVATEEAEGGGKTVTHTSNEVEVEATAPPEPNFTIKKEQRFEGESSYRTTKLAGTVGQRVEYKITVTNTGNTSLTLKPLSDSKCESGTLSGPSENPIKPGESAFFTCSRVLSFAGVFFNVATEEAEGGGKTVTHTSNEVEAEAKVPPEPNFAIKKEQRFEGEASYTTTKLVGKVGQRVEYKITVTNTGNTSLTLKPLSDAKCESGTLSGPSANPIKPGESAFFTCSRLLSSAGTFTNIATEETEGVTHTSNEVEVEVKEKARVFVGYVNEKKEDFGGPGEHPTPWLGSANVIFVGCGFGGKDECPMVNGADSYDAGAVRVEATSNTGTLKVTGAKVVIGPCIYEPWAGLNATVEAGHSLILTQTGKHKCTESLTEESSNFDSSESFFKSEQYKKFVAGGSKLGTCEKDTFIPEITLTINGQTTTVQDKGQTLNTGGVDPDECEAKTEFREWVQIQ